MKHIYVWPRSPALGSARKLQTLLNGCQQCSAACCQHPLVVFRSPEYQGCGTRTGTGVGVGEFDWRRRRLKPVKPVGFCSE